MRNDNNLKVWVLIVGLLVIAGLFALSIILIVRKTVGQAQQALQPVNDMTSNIGTQVAQVLNPTPTILPDPITIIHQVRSMSRLETIQYSVEKVIAAETGPGILEPLFGDKLLFVAHGIVIAGVDLSKLGPRDLWTQDGVLYVHLPEPEIFIVTLDNEKSYVYDRETGLLRHGDINLETTARRAAEEEIGKAVLEDGVLQLARQNAESYLSRLLRQLGYPEVIFDSSAPTPTP